MKRINLFVFVVFTIGALLIFPGVNNVFASAEESSDKHISEAELRKIASQIAEHESHVTSLQDKLACHSEGVYNIWKTVEDIKNVDGNGRKALIRKMKSQNVKLDNQYILNLFRRPSLVVFYNDFMASFRTLLEEAIEDGNVELTVSNHTGKQSIVITHINPSPVGFKATKHSGGDPIIEETHKFYVSFDVDDILKKIHQNKKYNTETDGKISTMCPTT